MALIGFALALVVSATLTPAVRAAATRSGVLDQSVGGRKVHVKSVPRLGGVAVVIAFFVAMAAVSVFGDGVGRNLRADHRSTYLLAGALVIAGLGLYDDLRGATASTKLAVQFAVAAAMYWGGLRINHVVLPIVGTIDLGIFGVPVTLLWVAGITNAINLIDGLDGLAGGIALVALFGIVTLALGRGDALMVCVGCALGGAVLGFLFFNFNPATIFMGDTGSMFLGFILATVSIQANEKTSTAVALLVPAVGLGLPIADTLLAMARRAARGVPLFCADAGHIHHRLLARGLTHRETVLVMYGISTTLGSAALFLTDAADYEALLTLGLVGGLLALVLWWLGFLRLGRMREVLDARSRNLAVKEEMQHVVRRLQAANVPGDLGAPVLAAARIIGAEHVVLTLGGFEWSRQVAGAPGAAAVFRACFALNCERQPGEKEVLELGWADGRSALDRDTEIAIERFCHRLSVELDRIRGKNVVVLGARARRIAAGVAERRTGS